MRNVQLMMGKKSKKNKKRVNRILMPPHWSEIILGAPFYYRFYCYI